MNEIRMNHGTMNEILMNHGKKSKLTSNMQKRAAFSLERGGGSTETYTRKFENLKTQRCGEGAPWGNEGKRGPFLFRVFQKIIAWYI